MVYVLLWLKPWTPPPPLCPRHLYSLFSDSIFCGKMVDPICPLFVCGADLMHQAILHFRKIDELQREDWDALTESFSRMAELQDIVNQDIGSLSVPKKQRRSPLNNKCAIGWEYPFCTTFLHTVLKWFPFLCVHFVL